MFLGFAQLVHDLRPVLVEIETGIKLCLLRKEIFQAGLLLEGATQLGTIVGEGLVLAVDFLLLVLDQAIKAAQNMLNVAQEEKQSDRRQGLSRLSEKELAGIAEAFKIEPRAIIKAPRPGPRQCFLSHSQIVSTPTP